MDWKEGSVRGHVDGRRRPSHALRGLVATIVAAVLAQFVVTRVFALDQVCVPILAPANAPEGLSGVDWELCDHGDGTGHYRLSFLDGGQRYGVDGPSFDLQSYVIREPAAYNVTGVRGTRDTIAVAGESGTVGSGFGGRGGYGGGGGSGGGDGSFGREPESEAPRGVAGAAVGAFQRPTARSTPPASGAPTQGRGGEPVTTDGQFVERYVDLSFPSRSADPELAYRFERSYASVDSRTRSDLGFGWLHNYEWRLHPQTESDVACTDASARWWLSSPELSMGISRSIAGAYTADDAAWDVRREPPGGQGLSHGPARDAFVLRNRTTGTEYVLSRLAGDVVWRLTQIRDATGNALQIAYELVSDEQRWQRPLTDRVYGRPVRWLWEQPRLAHPTLGLPDAPESYYRISEVTDTRGLHVYYHFRDVEWPANGLESPDPASVVCSTHWVDQIPSDDEHYPVVVSGTVSVCYANPFLECVSLDPSGCGGPGQLLGVEVGWGSPDPGHPRYNAAWGELLQVRDAAGEGHRFEYAHPTDTTHWVASAELTAHCLDICGTDSCNPSLCDEGIAHCTQELDLDGDGELDAVDNDMDGDGLANTSWDPATGEYSYLADTDGDGVLERRSGLIDPDSDGDGVWDTLGGDGRPLDDCLLSPGVRYPSHPEWLQGCDGGDPSTRYAECVRELHSQIPACRGVGTYADCVPVDGWDSPPRCGDELGECATRVRGWTCGAPVAHGDHAACLDRCETRHGPSSSVSYGSPAELAHRLTRVVNADGRVILEQRWGSDDQQPSFGRVVEQWVGPERAHITLEYQDLRLATSTSAYAPAFGDAVQVCPEAGCTGAGCGIRTYGAAQSSSVEPELRWAVTTRDVHGTRATDYVDDAGRVLRRIVFSESSGTANEVTDYEYGGPNGRLVGVRYPDGQRQCTVWSPRAQVVQSTRLPAPGARGSVEPLVTTLEYDTRGLIVASSSGVATDLARIAFEREAGTGRVFRMTQQRGAGAPVESTRFEYEPLSYDHYADYDFVDREQSSGVFHWRRTNVTPTFPTRVIHEADGTVESYRGYDQWSGRPRVTEVQDASGQVLQDQRYDYATHWGDVIRTYRSDPRFGEVRVEYDALRRPSRVRSYEVAGDLYREPTGRLRETSYTYSSETDVVEVSGWRESESGSLQDAAVVERRSDDFGNVLHSAIAFSPRASCAQVAWDGRVSRVVEPEGNGAEYTYDFAGRVRSVSAGDMGYLSLASTSCGAERPRASRTRAMEEVVRFEYGPGGAPSAVTRGGVRTSYVTDGFGRVIGSSDPSGLWQRRGYDARGRVIWEAAYDGRSIPTSGPAFEATFLRPVSRGGALVSMVEYRYDEAGRPVLVDRWRLDGGPLPSDVWESYAYDDAARRVTVRRGDGTTRVTERDALGRIVRSMGPDGTEARTVYEAHAVEQQITGEPVRIRTELDGAGRTLRALRLVEGASEPETMLDLQYDALGRLSSRQRRGMGVERFRYDAFGQLTEEWTDFGAGGELEEPRVGYEYDLNGQLGALVRYRGMQPFATEYEYDGLGRLVSQTDAEGRRVTVDDYVDGTSRPTQTTDSASGARRTVSYDAAGRPYVLTTWGNAVEPYGTRHVNFYTVLSQLQSVQLIHFGLDSQGRPHPVPSHTVGFQYDSLGNARTQTDSRGAAFQVAYTTDPYGRFQTTTYAGVSFTRHFDSVGRLSSVDLGSSQIANYAYDRSTTGPTSIAFGDDTLETRRYDARGQLRSIFLERNVGSDPVRFEPLMVREWAYGESGIPQLSSTFFPGRGDTQTDAFGVDPAGRLVAESRGVAGLQVPYAGPADAAVVDAARGAGRDWRTYDLDATGNWQSVVRQGSTESFSAGEVDQYLSSVADGVTSTFDYDADGNVAAWGGLRLQYDSERRPVDVTGPGGHASFRYDALGRRMQEVTAEGTTQLVWAGAEVLAIHEGDMATGPAWLRIPGAGTDSTVALVDLRSGERRFFHQDETNSTLAVTDRAHGLVEGYQYSAWGELADESGNPLGQSASGNRFLHHGALYDPWTQTYSLRAREYAPQLGRFLSQDPIGHAGGANVYAFGGGQYQLTDPSGLASWGSAASHFYSSFSDNLLPAIGYGIAIGAAAAFCAGSLGVGCGLVTAAVSAVGVWGLYWGVAGVTTPLLNGDLDGAAAGAGAFAAGFAGGVPGAAAGGALGGTARGLVSRLARPTSSGATSGPAEDPRVLVDAHGGYRGDTFHADRRVVFLAPEGMAVEGRYVRRVAEGRVDPIFEDVFEPGADVPNLDLEPSRSEPGGPTAIEHSLVPTVGVRASTTLAELVNSLPREVSEVVVGACRVGGCISEGDVVQSYNGGIVDHVRLSGEGVFELVGESVGPRGQTVHLPGEVVGSSSARATGRRK